MNREERQSRFEKTWAEIFFYHINKKYKFDYEAQALPNSIQATDVIGLSKSGKFPKLKLELSQATLKEFSEKDIIIFDCDQVENCIDKKIKKYTERLVNVDDIILLVQGHISLDVIKYDIMKLIKKYNSAPFKGIYYVYPPSYKQNNSFVMEIKKAF